jgi:glycosyltransferase involved in cell wall biosynthesis
MIQKVRARARTLGRLLHDPGLAQVIAFNLARRTAPYRVAFEKPRPLVSVCIATYNRGKLVTERAVASILAQSYANLEVIVVGDACTDDTAERMAKISDPRVRFVNLAERGAYPAEPYRRWMVAGTKPMNHALSLAKGDWITHLDDDDEHHPERIERILSFVREQKVDLAWHPFQFETEKGWHTNEAQTFALGQVTTSSIFYHSWLGRVRWDMEAWKAELPGDWHRLQRMRFHRPRMRRHPDALLMHYVERSQAKQ